MDANHKGSEVGRDDLGRRAEDIIYKVQDALKRVEKKLAKFQWAEDRRALENLGLNLDPTVPMNHDRIQRQIVNLLLSLPDRKASDAHMVFIHAKLAERDGSKVDKADILKLLKTESVSRVYAFSSLALDGKVQLTPKSNGAETATQ